MQPMYFFFLVSAASFLLMLAIAIIIATHKELRTTAGKVMIVFAFGLSLIFGSLPFIHMYSIGIFADIAIGTLILGTLLTFITLSVMTFDLYWSLR